MTEIVFKPERAKKVEGRGLYRAFLNRKPLDLLFRAKNAGEADAMLQYLLVEQTKRKILFVNPDLLENSEEGKNGKPEETEEPEDAKGA